ARGRTFRALRLCGDRVRGARLLYHLFRCALRLSRRPRHGDVPALCGFASLYREVMRMNRASGATVKAGDEIAQVISPEHERIVATYMQALADINGRTAELRIKARVAQDVLQAARSYELVTQEAVERLGAMTVATVTFRMEVLREYASARKAVVSAEAEVSESKVQLASLDEFIKQLRGHLDDVQRDFCHSKVLAPVGGIV